MRAATLFFALLAFRSAALADATVPPASRPLPVLTPARAVILDGPDECECIVPSGRFFKPTRAQVRRIEQWLPRALAEDAAQPGSYDADEILAQAAGDNRYYLGYVTEDDRRMITVHGFRPSEPLRKPPSHCRCIDDGGAFIWEMTFDLTAGTHSRLWHHPNV